MGLQQHFTPEGQLICRKCGKDYPPTREFFGPSPLTKSGVYATCRPCMARYHRKWRATEQGKAARRRQYQVEKERATARRREQEAGRRALAPTRYRAGLMRSGMIERSRAFGLPFDADVLTVKYLMAWIQRTTTCPCCGVALDYGYKEAHTKKDNSPTIDRLIPARGYVIGNVALICWRCNNLKRDATPDELEQVARWMRQSLAEHP